VFNYAYGGGSLKAFVVDGLSLVLLLRIWVFLVCLSVGFSLGFSVDAFFSLRVSSIFCCSFQRPGAWYWF